MPEAQTVSPAAGFKTEEQEKYALQACFVQLLIVLLMQHLSEQNVRQVSITELIKLLISIYNCFNRNSPVKVTTTSKEPALLFTVNTQ